MAEIYEETKGGSNEIGPLVTATNITTKSRWSLTTGVRQ
jgi:hypothetical protein